MLPSVHGKIGVDFLLRSLHIKYWSDLGGGLEYKSFYRQLFPHPNSQHVLAKMERPQGSNHYHILENLDRIFQKVFLQ